MPDLWDSGGPALSLPGGPEREEPARVGLALAPEDPTRAPQIDWTVTGLSPDAAGPIAFGLDRAYGPAWQQDYGTIAGRTLTGATPDEAFPTSATPERQQYRDALTQILAPEQVGTDHPDVQAALRGALADGMPQADRAIVNRAAIDAAVERDPEALLGRDPEIPREHLVAWRELAMKPVPQSVLDRMEAMNGSIRDTPQMAAYEVRMQHREPNEVVTMPSLWEPLDVRRAFGGVVNLDYYAVRVRMPDGVEPGALLNHVRTHLNEFVDTGQSSFAPYPNQPGGGDNVGRWNSTCPTGSFVTIDIPGNDGTVAVIDSGRDHWTFATVQSLGDGLHPVSGNRQFGYTENADGTVTFYTRGVDRITDPVMNMVDAFGHPVFKGGDALWRSFQSGVATYARENGGAAVVERPVIRRPDWAAVDDVLTGRESVRTFFNRQNRP